MAEKTPPHIGITPVIAYFLHVRIIERMGSFRAKSKICNIDYFKGQTANGKEAALQEWSRKVTQYWMVLESQFQQVYDETHFVCFALDSGGRSIQVHHYDHVKILNYKSKWLNFRKVNV